jgi:predicted dithiol-disulfide oxidoreductase (DUF899 family)
MSHHTVRFPNESDEYRAARDELLTAEMALRRQVEDVAALRRRLPLGGEVPADYEFDEVGGGTVRMSQLFAEGKNTLLLYSYMYGPEMKAPCVMCTSMLDALEGENPHIVQRVNFAVVAKSPAARIEAFARPRGWRNLRLLSSSRNSYNRDYQGETADGDQMPSMNVFVRRDGRIRHFWNSELLFAPVDEGQDSRHIDMWWPLWNLLDLTPEGRGEDWYPRLRY